MAVSQTHNYSVTITTSNGVNNAVSFSEASTGGLQVNLDEAIPDSSTDLQVAFEADTSEIKCFAMWADGELLVETNSGSSPADTFSLTADRPVLYSVDSIATNPISTDITALFCTNASGAAVNLKIRMIVDPTP